MGTATAANIMQNRRRADLFLGIDAPFLGNASSVWNGTEATS
jgi:hypothetical protein